MKPFPLGLGLVALAFVFTPIAARPVVFTTNTYIAPFDTTYDALDIIVSNAVLTVDGAHSFASVRLANGATLTHSAESNSVPTVRSRQSCCAAAPGRFFAFVDDRFLTTGS